MKSEEGRLPEWAGEDAGRNWCHQDRKFSIKTVRASIHSRGSGVGEVGLSSAYFKSCQCCKLQNAPLSFLWMILYRVLSAPSKQKVSEISNLASSFFFCLCPLPSFLRMSEAPYDATIAYVSLHGRPHRESPCFRSTLESSNSGAKCLIQDSPPPPAPKVKMYGLSTRWSPFPIRSCFVIRLFPVAVTCYAVVIVLLSSTSAVSLKVPYDVRFTSTSFLTIICGSSLLVNCPRRREVHPFWRHPQLFVGSVPPAKTQLEALNRGLNMLF